MNTNLTNIISFTQKFEALVNEAKAIGMTPEMCTHIQALDPNFSNNVSQLMEMLTAPTETTTTDTNKLCEDLLKRILADQYQPQVPEAAEEPSTEESTPDTTEEVTAASQ